MLSKQLRVMVAASMACICGSGLAVLGSAEPALAQAPPRAGIGFDRSVFEMATRGLGRRQAINFDRIAPGTDITDRQIEDVQFSRLDVGCDPYGESNYRCGRQESATLEVIEGSAGLSATSPPNLLSPGGADISNCNVPSQENDDLLLTVPHAVDALGLDIVFKSPDGSSFVGVRALDSDGNVLAENPFIPAPSAIRIPLPPPLIPFIQIPPFPRQFVGFVSDRPNIARIEIDEYDEDCENPDEHVGYDSVIYPVGVPNLILEDISCRSSTGLNFTVRNIGRQPSVPSAVEVGFSQEGEVEERVVAVESLRQGESTSGNVPLPDSCRFDRPCDFGVTLLPGEETFSGSCV